MGAHPSFEQITQEEAESLFNDDISWVNKALIRLVSDRKDVNPDDPLEQHQIDALGDFMYNCGSATWSKSKVRYHAIHSSSTAPYAASDMLNYTKGGGVRIPGLVKGRRWPCYRLFLFGEYD